MKVLDFIKSFISERGYPPVIREIGEAMKYTSPGTVHRHLNTLKKKGAIVWEKDKPRTIKVVAK
jgi:repressor LexA